MKSLSLCASSEIPQEPDDIKVNNAISSKRINFIDASKGLGILAVVFSHINYTPELLTVVFSFHMPLFFFISGMLFRPEKNGFGAFIKKKAKTLLCPYVFFYVFSLLVYILLEAIKDYQQIDWNIFASYFLQMLLAQSSRTVVNIPLWFIPCLMAVEIIYYFISKLKKGFVFGIAVALSASGWLLESGILPFDNMLLPWSLDSAFFTMGFFAIGNLCSCHITEYAKAVRSKRRSNLILIAVIILCTAIIVPVALYNEKISIGSKTLNNGLLLYITGLAGTFSVFNTGLLLEKNKFLIYLGKNSFCIMAVHYLFKDAIITGYELSEKPLYDETLLSETILPTLAVLLLSLGFSVLYNKAKAYFIKKAQNKK